MGVKYLVFTNKKTGAQFGILLDDLEFNCFKGIPTMSVEIWQNIHRAVTEIRPDLSAEFDKNCRTKETIVEFLNKNFPLEGVVEPSSWEHHIMSKTPDMLRALQGLKK